MMEIIEQHLDTAWFLLGFLLLGIEIVAFGMASGVLLFAGIGALMTGGLLWSGIVPETWIGSLATFSICTLASAALLWQPLKRIQAGSGNSPQPTSDLIGYTFRLEQEVTRSAPGQIRYSGVQWRVEIDHAAGVEIIADGELVEVVTVDAGLFRVRPVS